MISVTRLNGKTMWLNALLIEMIEETPDTYVTLTTGKRLIVLEKAEEVVEAVRAYHQGLGLNQASIKVQQTEESS